MSATCTNRQRAKGRMTRSKLQRKQSVEMMDVDTLPGSAEKKDQDDADEDMDENEDDSSDVHAPSPDTFVGNKARAGLDSPGAAAQDHANTDKHQGPGLLNHTPSMEKTRPNIRQPLLDSHNANIARPASPTSISSGGIESEFEIPEDDSNYDAVDNLSQPSGNSSMDIEREDEVHLVENVRLTHAIDWHDPATYEVNPNPEASQYSHGILHGFESPQFPSHPLYDERLPDFLRDTLSTAPKTPECSVFSGFETQSSSPSRMAHQGRRRGDSATSSAEVADEDNDSDPTEDEGSVPRPIINPKHGWFRPSSAKSPRSSVSFGTRGSKPRSPIIGKVQRLPNAKKFSFEAGQIVVSSRRIPKSQILRLKWPKDTNKGWASGAKEHKHKITKSIPPVAIESNNPPEVKDSVMCSLFKTHFGQGFVPTGHDGTDIFSRYGRANLVERSEAPLAFAGAGFQLLPDDWIQDTGIEEEMDEHIDDVDADLSQLIELEDDQSQEAKKQHPKSVSFTEPVADTMTGSASRDSAPFSSSTMQHDLSDLSGLASSTWSEFSGLSSSPNETATAEELLGERQLGFDPSEPPSPSDMLAESSAESEYLERTLRPQMDPSKAIAIS
ncbi:MAG: hypothetical protein M1831_006227 [Alyxoria varia]|nr:MAG: hypothetical protein M1831_006227 [Alyxoria varia]